MAFSDLTVDAFFILQEAFFDDDGRPIPFALRDKRNTQDDPLDEYIADLLQQKLPDALCQKAPGPLISPDMALYRPSLCNGVARDLLANDPSRIVSIEVKKLERAPSGQISRSTGLDYNTTPPCGTVRVYDEGDVSFDIRGFYLFVCLEPAPEKRVILTALSLCDGNVLNADFNFYLQITGKRTKGLGLGTYGDGVNRNRPMLIFANPLGAVQLDRSATLITRADLSEETRLGLVYQIGRTIPEGGQGLFNAYRSTQRIPDQWEPLLLVDPFPRPVSRIDTQQRGKFKVPIRPLVVRTEPIIVEDQGSSL
jgi:hypothetical protein